MIPFFVYSYKSTFRGNSLTKIIINESEENEINQVTEFHNSEGVRK